MTGLRFSLRSALYYAGSHACVLAGVALAVGVLVGALLVGDSVRFSLNEAALLRLGGIHYALNASGRDFGDDLATRVSAQGGGSVASALLLRGVALHQSPVEAEPRQVTGVQIVGVDAGVASFVTLPVLPIPENGVALNARLADRLGVRSGDTVSLRFSKPTRLPLDAPLASHKGDGTVRGTFTVAAVWTDGQLGRFGLSANQVVPFNAFVNLRELQSLAGWEHRANLLLAGAVASNTLHRALQEGWRLSDIGLTWRDGEHDSCQILESEHILMDPAVGVAAAGVAGAEGTLTYLVNSLVAEGGSGGGRMTPYSFVLAKGALGNAGPVEEGILVNRWVAEQTGCTTGGLLRVAYSRYTPWGRFEETSRVFTVRGILEMNQLTREREWAPRFPGLSEVSRCAEWDIGLPLDPAKMADTANEAYWDEYRDTPKAMVPLEAGQAMWANQFGNLTGVRFKAAPGARSEIEAIIRSRLKPEEVGLAFRPVRADALAAAMGSQDFGALFLGMSFFVMVAALMLAGMLFSLGVGQRSHEIGLLLAVGYRPSQVRWLLFRESAWVALAGSLLGGALGLVYTWLLIWGLTHFWQGAVATATIQFHVVPITVVAGSIAGLCVSLLALAGATWRICRRPARELLAEDVTAPEMSAVGRPRGWGARLQNLLPWCGLAAAVVMIGWGVLSPHANPAELFFAAGSLLLVSLLGLIRLATIRMAQTGGVLTRARMGIRNVGRRRARSLTVAGLLATGCFMVFAVASMQEDPGRGAALRSSGTGGFALYGESSLNLPADPATPAGWLKLRLDQEEGLNGVQVVPITVHEGDDASCLNLNRAQSPRLLGVDPTDFMGRRAFCSSDDPAGMKAWSLLCKPWDDGVVPGLAGDMNTAQWGLQVKTGLKDGAFLEMTGEKGARFKVKLVGTLPVRLSVFQGAVLIPRSAFSAHFPSEGGARLFLFDVPSNQVGMARSSLERRLSRYGLNLTMAVDRLREFQSVETTYMGMFLVLGGMGLLLGSAGMAVVVLRTMRERRSEFALLAAVGFSRKGICGLVFREFSLLLGFGLGAGVVASLAAMWPNLQDSGVSLPVATMLWFLTGITLFHLAWIVLAITVAMRGKLIPSLRNQ